ncbi:MAG: hypothetical protein VKL98_07910, partial [Cyanobacteriota bacterium]|nr:hypothetical protein [Cyanobacteriota bacterium]
LLTEPSEQPHRLTSALAEVSPPEALVTLKQVIDAYTPQVRILSPRPGEILDNSSVTVRLQVRGLPLFKDPTWQLGPHLHLFLDDQPYRAIYDVSEPIVFDDLSPGTHTLRVFASRPWHESFKNQGAFDQRTFHIFAQTPQREINASAPLLTYSRPQGTYGAEPIMLDFYLTNAPLHLSAQADGDDALRDWRVRCTINGQSFVFDQWQPIYLKGFEPGRNWLQLELIDAQGQPIDNQFNNIVRTIDFQPGGEDTLSKLVRGELDLEQLVGIVDPTYTPPPPPAPEPLEPEAIAPGLIRPEGMEPGEATPEAMSEAEPQQPEAVDAPPQPGDGGDGAVVPPPSPEDLPLPSPGEGLDAAPPEPEVKLVAPVPVETDQGDSTLVPLSPAPTPPGLREEPGTESTPAMPTPAPGLGGEPADPLPIPEVPVAEPGPESAPELGQPPGSGWRQGWSGRRRSPQSPTDPGPRAHGRSHRNQPRVAPESLDPESNLAPTLPRVEPDPDPTPQQSTPGETKPMPPLEPPVVNLEQPYI